MRVLLFLIAIVCVVLASKVEEAKPVVKESVKTEKVKKDKVYKKPAPAK